MIIVYAERFSLSNLKFQENDANYILPFGTKTTKKLEYSLNETMIYDNYAKRLLV